MTCKCDCHNNYLGYPKTLRQEVDYLKKVVGDLQMENHLKDCQKRLEQYAEAKAKYEQRIQSR